MASPGTKKIYSFNLRPPRLSALTVSPRDIIGFDPDRTGYQVGLDPAARQATITATAEPEFTSTYSVDDADAEIEGHQVALTTGVNEVTIGVTAEGETFQEYTVSVNRGDNATYGWGAWRDLDGLISAGNQEPSGLWTNGTTIWVADREDDKLYAYRATDGERDSRKDIDLHSSNTDPEGIWSNGTTMWVADSSSGFLHAYTLSDGSRDTLKRLTLPTANGHPEGIWSNGTTMWVADSNDNKIYAYNLSTKARDTTKEWDLDSANTDPEGIWSNDRVMWVADSDDDQLYAYNLSNGDRLSSHDVTTAPGNASPAGINGDGEVLWVIQGGDHPKAFAYNLPADLATLTANGTEVAGFDPDTTSYELTVPEEVREVTISGRGSHVNFRITDISPADFNSERTGHQVRLRGPVTTVTVTVASGYGVTKTYTITINHPTATSPPVITAGDATVDEDAAIGHTIASMSAVDPEGAVPLRWALDTRSSRVFEVVTTNPDGTSAELRLRGSLDYESTSSYLVDIDVWDPGGSVGRETITVSVRDKDDTGTVVLVPYIATLGTEAFGFVTDPDGGVAGETWQWYRSDTPSGPWTPIPGADTAEYTPVAGDLGKHLRLTARHSDALGSGRTAHGFTAGPVASRFEHFDYCYPANRSCDLTRAGRVTPGGRTLGRIDYSYDMDLFRVELEEGKTYVVDVLAGSSGNGTHPDPWLTGMFAIFNGDGTMDDDGLIDSPWDRMNDLWYDFDDGEHHPGRVYTDDDGGQGRDSRMFVKHFPAGVYYVLVRGGTKTGTYAITLNEAVEQETGVIGIQVDEWQDGSFDFPGDVDVFEVTLTAGQTYSILAERTGWWNADRRGYPHVIQIEEVATGTVTRLFNNAYERRAATYTVTTGGVYRITLQQARNYYHELRGGSYRVKVVANLLARGRVNWSGGRTVGESIGAYPTGISDGNGLPDPLVFSYQWYRADGQNLHADPGQVDTGITYTLIPGATGQSYTPVDADADHHLLVRVSFTDLAGNLEHLYISPLRKVGSVAEDSPDDDDSDVGTLDDSGTPSSDDAESSAVLSAFTVEAGHEAAQAEYQEAVAAGEVEEEEEEQASGPPSAPQNLSVSAQGVRSATLVWDDLGDDSVLGYQVLRRAREGGENGDDLSSNEVVTVGVSEFVVVAETGPSTTSYTDITLDYRSWYIYRVRARNAAGFSDASKLANARTTRRGAAPTGRGRPDGDRPGASRPNPHRRHHRHHRPQRVAVRDLHLPVAGQQPEPSKEPPAPNTPWPPPTSPRPSKYECPSPTTTATQKHSPAEQPDR